MLRFFRFNDPYRLLFVLLTVILLGIKTEFEFPSITIPELKGILVGEMMDGKRLYSEVWDSMPPVTAYVQYVLDFVFDRSILPRHILSWIIIFFQAAFFGVLLINNKAFNESNYLPAFLFSLLSFFSFDAVSLTRELIGSTLLLLAMNNLLKEVEFKRQHDETVHNLGFYLGLASLSVFSYIIFFIGTAILLFIFTRVELRRFALFVFGFALPHLLLNTWYYWFGDLDLLWANFYLANLEWSGFSFVSAKSLFLLTALPIAYFLFSLIMTRRDARLTKYQSQILQVMFLWFLFALIEVYLSRQRTPQALMVCVPPVAYFISHYLLLIKRKWIAETMLWLLLIGMMVGNNLVVRNKISSINLNHLFISNQEKNKLTDKKILVLDDNIGLYANNKPAGFFLEWKLAQPLFDDPGVYQHVLAVAEVFEKDPPDVVIDPKDKLKGLLPYLPKIQKEYRKSSDQYIRVAPSSRK
jgi:hypothetical protein